MPLPDAHFLDHMLAAAGRVAELVAKVDRAKFDEDWVVQNAVIRELEILGEAAGRLSAEFVSAHSQIPRREITGLRHKLIHDYFVVDLGIVWRTATVNLPEVTPMLIAAASAFDVDDIAQDEGS